MTKQTELARVIKLNFGDKSYEVNFPNVGQIIDAESRKVSLAQSQYGAMQRTPNIGTNVALDLIDAISYLTVFIPELTKDLRIESIMKMDPFQIKGFLNEYRKKFRPWYFAWVEVLKEEIEEEEVPDVPESKE